MENFRVILANNPVLQNLLYIGIHVVFIAIAFEAAAWFLGRKLEKMAKPFLGLDGNRDAPWRAARRETLRRAPKLVLRVLLYSIALILVFEQFGVDVTALSVSIGAAALLIGSALIPTMRDYAQGFVLLSEDSLAPGDVVEINGHSGTVEKWTLRATWIRDGEGKIHIISNREISSLVIIEKAAGNSGEGSSSRRARATSDTVAYDPLAERSRK